MGLARPPKPVMLVIAISSQYPAAFDWAMSQLIDRWGPLEATAPRFEFDHTHFYRRTMGREIQKQLVSFERLIDPGELAAIKLATNQLEREFEGLDSYDCERPLNLDPGYITEAKLVLATVKNRDHRIYLQDGIYAEVTLSYYNKQWNASRWTYPDYMTSENRDFLTKCRVELRRQMQQDLDH